MKIFCFLVVAAYSSLVWAQDHAGGAPATQPVATAPTASEAKEICEAPQKSQLLHEATGTLADGSTVHFKFYKSEEGPTLVTADLNIPSQALLYGAGQFGAQKNNKGKIKKPKTGAPTGPYHQCLSSGGMPISPLDEKAAIKDLSLSLRGVDGSYLELGSQIPPQAYMSGSSVEGAMILELPGQSAAVFIMTK